MFALFLQAQLQPRSWSALQEQIQAGRQARKASLRSRRQALNSLNHGGKPGEKLKDNVDKDGIDSQRQPSLNEFKSDLLTPFDHCACM